MNNPNKQTIFNYLAVISLLINFYTLYLFQQKSLLIIKKVNSKENQSLGTNENHSDDLSLKTENKHSLAEVNEKVINFSKQSFEIIEELKRKKMNL